MARFKFEVAVPSVLVGVMAEAKTPKAYVFNFPEDLEDFAAMLNAAEKNKGNKDRHGEWEFVTILDLPSQEECLKMRNDLGELNKLAKGRTTTRSRIKSYTVNGKELWFFGIRALTDTELEKKDERKAFKEANKDAISNADLLKIVATIK